jgi:hypothetical protein
MATGWCGSKVESLTKYPSQTLRNRILPTHLLEPLQLPKGCQHFFYKKLVFTTSAGGLAVGAQLELVSATAHREIKYALSTPSLSFPFCEPGVRLNFFSLIVRRRPTPSSGVWRQLNAYVPQKTGSLLASSTGTTELFLRTRMCVSLRLLALTLSQFVCARIMRRRVTCTVHGFGRDGESSLAK